MIEPVSGDKIKIILSCGKIEYGIVEEWAVDDKRGITWSVLKPINTNSTMRLVLQNYWIAGFVIINDDNIKSDIPKKIESDPEIETPPINDLTLRTKKLVELRKMQAKAKEEEIKRHLSRKDIGGVKEIEYKLPSFIKRTK